MTVNISKTTVIENVFKNFYDLVVAISGFSNIVYPTFPDAVLNDKADYPVIVINSPVVDCSTFTFGKNRLNGTIAIDVYTTTSKDTDQNASKIIDKIETSKSVLAGVGLRQVGLDGTNPNMIPHGKIKVFMQTLTFKYKFYSSSTIAF